MLINTTCHTRTSNAPWMKSNELTCHAHCTISIPVDGRHLESLMPRVRIASRTSNGPVCLRLATCNSHRSTRHPKRVNSDSKQSKCRCSGTKCIWCTDLGHLVPSRLGTRAWDHRNSKGEGKKMQKKTLYIIIIIIMIIIIIIIY